MPSHRQSWLHHLVSRVRHHLHERARQRDTRALLALAQHELNDLGIGRSELERLMRPTHR